MKLSTEIRRRNVAYARYQRVLVVLVMFPVAAWREIVDPCTTNATWVAVTVALGALAGWMYREAIRWWTET